MVNYVTGELMGDFAAHDGPVVFLSAEAFALIDAAAPKAARARGAFSPSPEALELLSKSGSSSRLHPLSL